MAKKKKQYLLLAADLLLALQSIPSRLCRRRGRPSATSAQAHRHFITGAQLLSRARSTSTPLHPLPPTRLPPSPPFIQPPRSPPPSVPMTRSAESLTSFRLPPPRPPHLTPPRSPIGYLLLLFSGPDPTRYAIGCPTPTSSPATTSPSTSSTPSSSAVPAPTKLYSSFDNGRSLSQRLHLQRKSPAQAQAAVERPASSSSSPPQPPQASPRRSHGLLDLPHHLCRPPFPPPLSLPLPTRPALLVSLLPTSASISPKASSSSSDPSQSRSDLSQSRSIQPVPRRSDPPDASSLSSDPPGASPHSFNPIAPLPDPSDASIPISPLFLTPPHPTDVLTQQTSLENHF